MNPFYRVFLAGKGLPAAVRNGDLGAVRWLCKEYCPSVVPVKAMLAAAHGKLHVLKWLFEAYPSVRVSTFVADKPISAGHLNVVQ